MLCAFVPLSPCAETCGCQSVQGLTLLRLRLLKFVESVTGKYVAAPAVSGVSVASLVSGAMAVFVVGCHGKQM